MHLSNDEHAQPQEQAHSERTPGRDGGEVSELSSEREQLSEQVEQVARFKNRIVGYGSAPAGWFLANPDNFREHPPNQKSAMRGALTELGWIDDVTVNKRTSELWPDGQRLVETLIDGHERVEEALAVGDDTEVPFKYVDLAPDEERYALATKDAIGAMAVHNSEKLSELLDMVRSKQGGVTAMLNDLRGRAGVALAEQQAQQKKQSEQVTIPEQWLVIIECKTEEEQAELLERFQEEGIKCRALIS